MNKPIPASEGIPPRELTRMASFTGLASPRDDYNQKLQNDDESFPDRGYYAKC